MSEDDARWDCRNTEWLTLRTIRASPSHAVVVGDIALEEMKFSSMPANRKTLQVSVIPQFLEDGKHPSKVTG